ncbi:MAG: CPBP family intramembrane metalloprotease [Anaerolineales bacterium]
MKRGISWAWFVFFVQVPFVVWYAQGVVPIHPIVVMLPLVGLLNFKVEKRAQEGLGVRLVGPGRSLLLALIYAALSVTGWLMGLRLEGTTLGAPALTAEMTWTLVESFLVGVFIIALWEEVINRGYIQTRLQAAWGFWGVIVTSLLFAAVHVPSALLDYNNDVIKASLRFVQTGLVGFALGYVYWRSGSVFTTIAIHGLNNFVTGALAVLSGVSSKVLFFSQIPFQFLWLVGQVGLTLLLSHVMFKRVFKEVDTPVPKPPNSRGPLEVSRESKG